MPKIGEYKVSEETMLKLMNYVERVYNDRVQPLSNKTLIDNHIPSWEVLIKIEAYVIRKTDKMFNNWDYLTEKEKERYALMVKRLGL